MNQTDLPKTGEKVAIIHTNRGDITVRLFPEDAPKAVENFMTLAQKDYYNGVIFHRVIADFMIQGGDPTGTGMGGESCFGEPFENETDNDLQHIRGALSMANAGPDTNGSQFFIVHGENAKYLDGDYSIFGQVIEGMDVVDDIATVDTDPNDRPLEKVKMFSIRIIDWE